MRFPCGHTCSNACSDDHNCACECPVAVAMAASKTDRSLELVHLGDDRGSREHQAMVNRYKAFANGGAKAQDEILAQVQRQNAEQVQMQLAKMVLEEQVMGEEPKAVGRVDLLDDGRKREKYAAEGLQGARDPGFVGDYDCEAAAEQAAQKVLLPDSLLD